MLKSRLCTFGDPDIVCVSETHLLTYESMEISDFKFIGQSRSVGGASGETRSGGVAILVKDAVYHDYSMEICCADYDGILGIKLLHLASGYQTVVVCNYLPPAGSPYGRDAEGFFERLLLLSYQMYDVDCMLYVGDFNARIGSKQDLHDAYDLIGGRMTVDRTLNGHGSSLLTFLNDSCSCILNGRLSHPEFTCFTANGRSEVDYAIVPVDVYKRVKSFCVVAMQDIVHELGLEDMVGVDASLPDHSLLQITIYGTGHYVEDYCRGLGIRPAQMGPAKRVPRTFKNEFMNNERIRRAVCGCIDQMLEVEKNQENIDACYVSLCKIIQDEMCSNRKAGRRKNTPCKPYWSQTLTDLWRTMRTKYKEVRSFLRSKSLSQWKKVDNPPTQVLHYLRCVSKFDCELRRAKRKYCQERIVQLDEMIKMGDPKLFWDAIEKLGPRSRKQVICEAFDSNGAVTRDADTVLLHWKTAFAALYGDAPAGDFDDEFYVQQLMGLDEFSPSSGDTPLELNRPITLDEVKQTIMQSKLGKATGVDSIPNEALRNPLCISALHKLFSLCFENGLMPTAWSNSVVVPIGKGRSSVSTDPLSHRGLSMQSCVYKTYSLLISRRVNIFAENNDLLSDVQNGFRRDRGCIDHVYSLCELIRLNTSRPECKVYSLFVDFKKAFPSIDRNLLLKRLSDLGVDGKVFQAIALSYKNPRCCLRINGHTTDYFPNNFGTLEGDCQSPLNFALFLDTLLRELQESGLGICYGNTDSERIACLAFADDLVLLASSQTNLQKMADIVWNFCNKWRMTVNVTKTKVLVFKKNYQTRDVAATIFYNGVIVEQVKSYRYLGVTVDDVLSFKSSMQELSSSGSRALGAVIQKTKALKDLGYKTYSHLIHSCVFTVTDYGCEVTGMKSCKEMENVLNRAARFYLGVSKSCALPCLHSEMGWLSTHRRRQRGVIRYYNRLIGMDNARLPKKLFLYTKNNTNSWAMQARNLLQELDLLDYWAIGSKVPVDLADLRLREKCKEEMLESVRKKPKLRLFETLRFGISPADHVVAGICKRQRSLITQLRCGMLPIRLETGRYNNEDLEDRVCEICDCGEIEDEVHLLLFCSAYNNERRTMLDKLYGIGVAHASIPVLCKHPFIFGAYLDNLWRKRTSLLAV